MGEGRENGRTKKTVFLTVGTTSFDALVKAVDSGKVKEELFRKGYSSDILIQMGCGSYFPSKISRDDGSLSVDYFTFSPSIADYMKYASLIISHAGDETSIIGLKVEIVQDQGELQLG